MEMLIELLKEYSDADRFGVSNKLVMYLRASSRKTKDCIESPNFITQCRDVTRTFPYNTVPHGSRVCLFSGEAADWAMGIETGPSELDPLPDFKPAMMARFTRRLDPVRARLGLMDLRDNGDLEEYLGKAQSMVSRILGLSGADEMPALVNGLAPREKEAVLRYGAESRTTIVEICRYVSGNQKRGAL
ncbi:MAG: uncharacterized protein A8A55_3168 [Amphiamblys sp. WSBS2006]|nr:MAG: uncharacterized protein A8A55_3168 [Amphiamblys sp. WSBS2006]